MIQLKSHKDKYYFWIFNHFSAFFFIAVSTTGLALPYVSEQKVIR